MFAHADGVGIVETERPAHAHAALGQGRAKSGFVPKLLSHQDLARDRAGVLGINVELIGLKGVEEDLRPPQLAPMASRDARLDESGRGPISPRITDSVNTLDPTRTVWRGTLTSSREYQREKDGQARHQESPFAARSRSWRWALTNWVTNGSAGSSIRVRSAPR